jgi:signal transduction histidine kinase
VVADDKVIENGLTRLAATASVGERQAPPLRVPPGRGELEFQYGALGFAAPEKNRFQYQLSSVDADWINAGARRVAYYNNLAPGHYQFRVRACNQDGVWNDAGAALAVWLKPNFWQTLWFRGLAVLGLMGGAGGAALYATRRRMQRKLELLEQRHAVVRERGRIAKDMHDQIGAGLTHIGLLGEFARRDANRIGGSTVHAERICASARELAQTLDEIVWMVNPKNDTLNKLAVYLAAYAEEFFKATSIGCRLDIPARLPPYRLSAELRHNLFLTVKETLNNIVKHSGASEVWVRVALERGRLEILIEDNGVGFRANAANSSRNGLSNMRERLEDIGGALRIRGGPNNGTRVSLRVPIAGARAAVENHRPA